jgi:predicted hydrocarbon binding protein
MSNSQDDGARRLIVPAVPLALLQAVRDSDRPGEVLEDEDLSVSLPRRLGLTGVFDAQIRRYQSARQWQRSVPIDDLINLLRLVLRRPDAAAILVDAGHRVARSRYEHVPEPARIFARFMPRRIVFVALRGIVRRTFRSATGADSIDVAKPLSVTLHHSDVARLDNIGTACRLFGGMLEEIVHLYTRKPLPVSHAACMGLGHADCAWQVDAQA